MDSEFDAIVIGGGPAGSAAATALALDGRRVVLLERTPFPRYHVGESLLPATVHGICKTLGVAEAIRDAGFVRKRGGTFKWGSNPEPWTFAFGDQLAMPDADFAYQVERARFDEILLRNAESRGTDVREGWTVERVLEAERIEGVVARDPGGAVHEIRARYVIDASGGSGLLSNVVGTRRYDAFFRNLALFGYFEGGRRLDPPNEGNILTVAFDEGWFWYIPLSDGRTSVGAVVRKEHAHRLKKADKRALLRELIERCPMVSEMLTDATDTTEAPYDEVRLLRDFSYTNDRFYDRGGVLVGDAACFIDPVFSSGVHLATLAGLMAARSINSCLAGEVSEEDAFAEFTARYRREYGVFYQFLIGFYEIHRDPDSYFWDARKIVKAASSDREAFVRLVSGLAAAEPRFQTVDAFLDSTVDESRVLEAASQIESEWSTRDPALAERARDHVNVLNRERRELLAENVAPVLEGGLVASADGLRWRRQSGEEALAS